MLKKIVQSMVFCSFLALGSCVTNNQSGSDSQFDDLDSNGSQTASPDQPVVADKAAESQASKPELDGFADLENQSQGPVADQAQAVSDQKQQELEPQTPLAEEMNTAPKSAEAQPPPNIQAPVPEVPAQITTPVPGKPIEITGLKYKANETGGTVLIEGSGPLNYTTRSNPEHKQFIVEISNSKLPEKLKRPLNTKDFNGGIGAIDAYQNFGSKTSRFVVQLRDGATEPFIQVEGNTLLIVSSDPNSQHFAPTASTLNSTEKKSEATTSETTLTETSTDADLNINLNDSRILTSQSLVDFISGNSKFYGKKISVEFNKTPVVQAIRFFMEETGINMIIDKEVSGEVTMKLRQVPWDQAFITMLRMSDLIYQRQGSILRIATVSKLQKEEDDAKRLADAKRLTQPLKVRNFFMNFVATSSAISSIKELLKENGKDSPTLRVVDDPKNGKIIVQETEENLALVEKIIKNLDMPVKQVLIEGKIVEASEKFQRGVGISWGLGGQDTPYGSGSYKPTLSIGASKPTGADLALGFQVTNLPVVGDLTAQLTLAELENNVKVISAPRLLTLTGEQASINIESGLVTKSATVAPAGVTGASGVTTTFAITKLPVKLDVTPKVTPDNFVSMKLSVTRTVGTIVNELVNTEERKVDTSVLVRDGQTTAIGGLYQTDTQQSVNGVPGLKDIPFIGGLFRSKNDSKQKTELLIFITPRVVTQDVQTSSVDPQTPAL